MKRHKVLLELIQVSTDKVPRIKFFGAVKADVLPDFAAVSSIYIGIYMTLENCFLSTFTQQKIY